MKIAVLSSFPLVDNHYYKKLFLKGVIERRGKLSEAVLIYSHTRAVDYYREAKNRFGFGESLRKFRQNRAPEQASIEEKRISGAEKRQLSVLAAEAGIEVVKFDRFGTNECVRFLKSYRPDVIHNLSGMYIPRTALAVPRIGVVSGHYGLLPEVRGADTVRWSILLDISQAVSHMFLAPAMDMGDIISKETVSVTKGDDLSIIRRKCQLINGAVHLKLLDRIITGDLSRTPQKKEQGTYFYPMGRLLREKVDRVLRERLYKCYAV